MAHKDKTMHTIIIALFLLAVFVAACVTFDWRE